MMTQQSTLKRPMERPYIETKKPKRWFGSRSLFGFSIGAIPLIWQAVFFLMPMLFLVMMTFWKVEAFRPVPAFSFDNWSRILGSTAFQRAFMHTLELSLVSSVMATLIALPAACILAFRTSPQMRTLFLGLLIVPVFTSYVLRAYAWQIVLSPLGLVNSLLGFIGIEPIPLLGGKLSLYIGFMTLTLPIVILIQTFALMGVDRSHLEAASNLGCRPYQVFFHVLLPSIRGGLVLGASTTFMLTFGDYIAPLLLSGSRPPTLSILIIDTIKSGAQWPRASVIGIVMMLTIGSMLILAQIISSRRIGK